MRSVSTVTSSYLYNNYKRNYEHALGSPSSSCDAVSTFFNNKFKFKINKMSILWPRRVEFGLMSMNTTAQPPRRPFCICLP